jgi:uncharacterized RDD family membrane protein YckC
VSLGDPPEDERQRRERDAFGNPLPSGSPETQPASAPAPAPPPPPPTWAPPAGDAPPPPPPGYAPPAGVPGTVGPAASEGTFAGHVLASWGSRVVAVLLDLAFILAGFVPGVVLLAAGSDVAGGLALAAAAIWSWLGYAAVFMMRGGRRNGQTPGKQMVGIRVVRERGEPVGYGFALLREFVVKGLLIGTVGSLFLYIPILLDYLWPLWDEQNRALHDMVASTRVVEA